MVQIVPCTYHHDMLFKSEHPPIWILQRQTKSEPFSEPIQEQNNRR